jgi:hypothetical protein
MDAAAARRAAEAAFTAVRNGRDPQAEKVEAKGAQSISELCKEWLANCERRVLQTELEQRERESGRALSLLMILPL